MDRAASASRRGRNLNQDKTMTLKTLQIAGLGALLGLAATTANAADTANASLTMNTSAPRTCAVTGDVTGTGPATISGGAGGAGANLPSVSVNFGSSLVDPVTALPTFSTTVDRAGVTLSHKVKLNVPAHCNYAGSRVSVQSVNGGLRREGAAPAVTGVFGNGISLYTEVERATGGQTRATVAGQIHTNPNSKGSGQVANAWNGALQVTLAPAHVYTFPTSPSDLIVVRPAADGTPLLAGTYSDTVRIRFGATAL